MKKQASRYFLLIVLFLSFIKPAHSSCIASFSFENSDCQTVLFNDLTAPMPGYSITGWYWEFGDGYSSTLPNPAHVYAVSATYIVSLTVTVDSMGVTDNCMVIHNVVIPEEPSVNFNWNPDPSIVFQPTYFTGSSGGTITTWHWEFGDGGASIEQNPAYVYSSTGIYSVTLTVTDINNCSNDVTQLVTVTDGAQIDFAWDQNCFGFPTQFTVLDPPTNLGGAASFYWEFGDGGTSIEQDPIHTYSQTGDFIVSLSITDTAGSIQDTSKKISIVDPPVSYFIVTDSACVGSDIFFNDSSYVAMDSIIEWHWDFGDGNSLTIQSPDNPDVFHSYDTSGIYTVSLAVISSDSCENTSQNNISITSSPFADFSYDVTCAEDTVLFTDLSSPNGSADIISWNWDFGDPASGSNDTSILQNPYHLFSSPGYYDVQLSITNLLGCIDTTLISVPVTGPLVNFFYTNDCQNTPIYFEVDDSITNVSEVVTWQWDFGDGNSSNIQNPTHTYLVSGNFDVVLTISTINDCSSDTLHTISIYELPSIDIYPQSYYATINEPVQFNCLSSDSLNSWSWDFGDGSISSLADPVHSYTDYGLYIILLSATDTNLCTGADTDQIIIQTLPYFPDSNAIWNTINYSFGTNSEYRIRHGLSDDTILNSLTRDTSYSYRKVLDLYDTTLTHPNSTYFGAIREVDGKVYLKIPDLPETILYDFEAVIGDTIWYSVGGSACMDEVEFEEYEHYKIISNIDSIILLDGVYHKRLHLEGEYLNDIWVLGVGSTEWIGLLNPLIIDLNWCGDDFNFACLKDNDKYLFIDNPECELCFCYLLTEITETFSESEILTYPVPTNDKINVMIPASKEGIQELHIFNQTGSLVFKKYVPDNEVITINIENWTFGSYTISLIEKGRSTHKGKFIISN